MSDKLEDELHEHAKLLQAALDKHNITKKYYANWVGISRPKLDSLLQLKKVISEGVFSEGFNRSDLLLASQYFGRNYFKLPPDFFDKKLVYSTNYADPDRIVLLTGAGFSNQWVDNELESIPHALKKKDITEQERPIVDAIEEIAVSLDGSKNQKNSSSRDLLNQLHYYWRLSKSIEGDSIIKKNSHKKILAYEAQAASAFWKDSLIYCIRIFQDYYGYGAGNFKSKSGNSYHGTSSLSITDLEQILSNICNVSGNNRVFVYLANYYCPLEVLAHKHLIEANFYTHFNEDGKFTSSWFGHAEKKNRPNIYFTNLFGSIGWRLDDNQSLKQLSREKMINDSVLDIERLGIAVKTIQQIESSMAFSFIIEEFNAKILSCQTLIFWGHNLDDRLLLFRILNLWFQRKHNPFQMVFIDTEDSSYIGKQTLEDKFVEFQNSFGVDSYEQKGNLDLFLESIIWVNSSELKEGKVPMKWYQ